MISVHISSTSYNRIPLDRAAWLHFHFVCCWSMISSFLFCVVFLLKEQKWKCIMSSSNKRWRKCADVLQKSGITAEWRVFTKGFLLTYICVNSRRDAWMPNIHTISFWFCTSAQDTHAHTPPQQNSHFLFLFHSWHTHTHTTICRQAHTLTHRHMCTPLLAVYHSGLSCCLSNQCMGSFQLQWSEHFIPFPSFPLLNTQTHKYMLRTNTHTLRTLFSTLAHQDRLCSPQ